MRILAELQASGAATCLQQGIQAERTCNTYAILEQAAALAENTAIQQEIILHSQRQLVLQVKGNTHPLRVKGAKGQSHLPFSCSPAQIGFANAALCSALIFCVWGLRFGKLSGLHGLHTCLT